MSTISLSFASSESVHSSEIGQFLLHLKLPESFELRSDPVTFEGCQEAFSDLNEKVFDYCLGLVSGMNHMIKADFRTTDGGSQFYPLTFANKQRISLLPISLTQDEAISVDICCVKLPNSFEENSDEITLSLMEITAGSSNPPKAVIPTEPVGASPRILAVNDWSQLRLQFDPPSSNSFTIISFVLQTTVNIPANSILILTLPDITCSITSLHFQMSTGDTALFRNGVFWDPLTSQLTMTFANILYAGHSVTVTITDPNVFKLPISSPLNSPAFKARIEDQTLTVSVISETSFFQTDEIFPDATVLHSRISIARLPPIVPIGGKVSPLVSSELAISGGYLIRDLTLELSISRQIFPGQKIILKLPGYQASVREIPLQGPLAVFINNQVAIFDPSSTILTMEMSVPLFFDGSGNDWTSVTFPNMTIPFAQYTNDPSLLISVTRDSDQDYRASDFPFFQVQESPKIDVFGTGKTFIVSDISFAEERGLTNTAVNLVLRPTVPLFEGSVIKVYLRGGFERRLSGVVGSSATVNLQGLDALSFDLVTWTPAPNCLLFLRVRTEGVIRTDVNTEILIPKSEGFFLPELLTQNDQSLQIESSTTSIIYREPIKLSPFVGFDLKRLTSGRVVFDPSGPKLIGKISIIFVPNFIILDGSHVIVHLGGMMSDLDSNTPPPRSVSITGDYANSFTGNAGMWNKYKQELVLSLQGEIQSGTQVKFDIPISEKFVQPTVLDLDDQSFYITIPDSGMTSDQYLSVDKIGTISTRKGFSYSEIFYGLSNPLPPIPNEYMSMHFVFVPTFDILSGSIVRFSLPDFRHVSGKKVYISEMLPSVGNPSTSLVNIPPLGVSYKAFMFDGKFFFGSWDPTACILDFTVSDGSALVAGESVDIWVENGFQVPDSKLINDPSLTIQVVGNQIANPTVIQRSPAIVDRKFEISSIDFFPQNPGQTTSVVVRLVASVDLKYGTVIDIGLPGFVSPMLMNSTGEGGYVPDMIFVANVACWIVASQIEINCDGSWDWKAENLLVRFGSAAANGANDQSISRETTIEIQIMESAGFILPQFVDASVSGGLTISAVDNIPSALFTSAPLVGHGPFLNQTFCLDLYQLNGVSMHLNFEPAMPSNMLMDPVCTIGRCGISNWVRDPCSARELERCGCSSSSSSPGGLSISGYSLSNTDRVKIVSAGEDCDSGTSFAIGVQILDRSKIIQPSRQGDTMRGMEIQGVVSSDSRTLTITPIRGIKSGQYDICYKYMSSETAHVIGRIFVKPSCESPLVLLGSVCYETCPSGYVPVNGECSMFTKPPLMSVLQAEPALAGTLAFVYPNADYLGLSYLAPTDSTFIFFQYVMIENLRSILFEEDPSRFVVAAIGTGEDEKLLIRVKDTIIVTVVFTPSNSISSRTSFELFTLLSHLIKDYDSVLYANEFFSTLLPEETNVDEPILVVFCETSGKYQTVCPLGLEPPPDNPFDLPPWFYVTAIVSGILGGVVWVVINSGIYRIDHMRRIFTKSQLPSNGAWTGQSSLFALIENNNDFSLIRTVVEKAPVERPAPTVSVSSPPVTPPVTPPISPSGTSASTRWEKLYKDVKELEPQDRAQFARDWLEGRWMDISVFMNARRRLRPPPPVASNGGPPGASFNDNKAELPATKSAIIKFFEAKQA